MIASKITAIKIGNPMAPIINLMFMGVDHAMYP